MQDFCGRYFIRYTREGVRYGLYSSPRFYKPSGFFQNVLNSFEIVPGNRICADVFSIIWKIDIYKDLYTEKKYFRNLCF